jgi:ABC-type sugar transport system ATPase subunit
LIRAFGLDLCAFADRLILVSALPGRSVDQEDVVHHPSGTLAATKITKSFGAEVILDGATLLVPPGARIGVVGPNGSGKTTLLRLLAGLEEPDTGAVERRPETVTLGYLPQEADAPGVDTQLG